MSSVNLKPLYDNVVLEVVKETSRGGIEIPLSSQKQALSKARVVAVGDGKWDLDNKRFVMMTLKPGDLVYINTYLGMTLKIDPRTEFIVQKEEDVRVRIDQVEGEANGL